MLSSAIQPNGSIDLAVFYAKKDKDKIARVEMRG